MIIFLKNKQTLVVDDFKFKCCIGKNGLKKEKREGDKCTPKGIFQFVKIYYRKDRVSKPITKIKTKVITKNLGWCNDPEHPLYNKEINVKKKISHEKLFRRDHKYDYILILDYNFHKTIPYRGSAIFLHLTKNYSHTAGCIAIKKNDFLIISKLIRKTSKIKIS